MSITTKVVSLNPIYGKVYSIQHYVIKFVNNWNIVESGVKHHKSKPISQNIGRIEHCIQNDSATICYKFMKLFQYLDLFIRKLFVKKRKFKQWWSTISNNI